MSRKYDRQKEIEKRALEIHKAATQNPQFISAIFQISLERMPLKWIFWSAWMAIWRRIKLKIKQNETTSRIGE